MSLAFSSVTLSHISPGRVTTSVEAHVQVGQVQGTGHTQVMRSLTLTLTEPSNSNYVGIRKLTKQYNPVRGLVCAGY